MLTPSGLAKIIQMFSMTFILCALSATSFADTTSKGKEKTNFVKLHAEISLQEEKRCGRKEVNDRARRILETAESLALNSTLNLTVVKMHAHNCVSLAFLISEGRVTVISQPTVKKVMDEFCAFANSWTFPNDGDSCDETKYYQ